VRELLGPDDHLILGTDLVKDIDVIERAYNDAAGVTAAFNLNILNDQRRTGCRLHSEAYKHLAFTIVITPESKCTSPLVLKQYGSRPSTHGRPAAGRDDLDRELTQVHARVGFEMLDAAGLKLDEWLTGEQPAFGLALASPA
jgi:L-histidine N-alpha-methyltransferase